MHDPMPYGLRSFEAVDGDRTLTVVDDRELQTRRAGVDDEDLPQKSLPNDVGLDRSLQTERGQSPPS
jgi:hypothetical protein